MLTEKKQRVAKESGAAVEPEQEQTRAAGPEVEAEQVRETEQEAEAEQVWETGQEAEAERGREQSKKPRSSRSQNRRKPAVRQENPEAGSVREGWKCRDIREGRSDRES